MSKKIYILWFGRDLRISDSPLLHKSLEKDCIVIPVFIYDHVFEEMLGAAPKWRLHQSLRYFAANLHKHFGAKLILRRGKAQDVLDNLIEETGAQAVYWSRQYDKASLARNTSIKSNLTERGIKADSVNSSLLFEPWTVSTKSSGGPYKVYSPFCRALDRESIAPPLEDTPAHLGLPEHWPDSDCLDDWGLEAHMNRGGAVVAQYASVGEEKAHTRLETFLDDAVATYKHDRNYFYKANACSGLSQHLTCGEISPHQIWHKTTLRLRELGDHAAKGGEHFLKEILWREFAYHLLYHFPDLPTQNFREEWDAFPWQENTQNDSVQKWYQGRTGVPLVDAAMREMYTTGTMHNRARMMVASYLCKHLMTHWRVGEQWFRECLIDWDIANNALGWQWTAGSGPDAAPYFRIYNADSQVEQYDPDQKYIRTFLAEQNKGQNLPKQATDFFKAVPKSWHMSPDDTYPEPVVAHKTGRERALDAYTEVKKAKADTSDNA